MPWYDQNLVFKQQQFVSKIYATCSASKHMLFSKIRVYKSNSNILINIHRLCESLLILHERKKSGHNVGM